jgi:hypothetical protein
MVSVGLTFGIIMVSERETLRGMSRPAEERIIAFRCMVRATVLRDTESQCPAKMSAMIRPSALRRCWRSTGLLMWTLLASSALVIRLGYS